MHNENSLYNPNFTYNDNSNHIREFVRMCDVVPLNYHGIKNDTAFIENHLVRNTRWQQHQNVQSVFTSHLLKTKNIEPKAHEITNQTWIPDIITLCVILFALAHYQYFKRMQQIFKALFIYRFFNQLSRDSGLFGERVSIFLFISYILAIALFFYKVYDFYYNPPDSIYTGFLLYAGIASGMLLFYVMKMSLFSLSGWIFSMSKETSDYVLNIYIYGQIAGIVLLPFIILICYACNQFVIFTGIFVLALLYIYRLFRGVLISGLKAKISLYYIFMYFCTLEIIPLLLLGKVLNEIIA